jgi:predicted nucleic acid-binding protein
VTLVIDSSAVLKWVLNETDSDAAQRILDDYRSGRVDLIAPSLMPSEVGNVLAKLVRGGALTAAQAMTSFYLVVEHSPALCDATATWERALTIATEHRQSYYDCLFLALALDRRCNLITADERFFRGMHHVFPGLTLLRDYLTPGQSVN